jgi:hypothetical protein
MIWEALQAAIGRPVIAIDDRQNSRRGRLIGTRHGWAAVCDERGVVRTFHPRFVSLDAWAIFRATQRDARAQ